MVTRHIIVAYHYTEGQTGNNGRQGYNVTIIAGKTLPSV
jgi:hypothetical protein